MNFVFITLFLSAISPSRLPQDIPDTLLLSNHVFDNKIKSVQLYKEGWNLSYPIASLNSDEKLVLHFDLLGDKPASYNYTFIHCDKDWKRSDIFPNDYLDGFPENPAEDFQASFNTTVSYYHYSITFPNDRVKITCSGNYIIMVCPADKPDEPILTQRFIVAEDIAHLKISAHRPQMTQGNNANQQVDFTLNYSGLDVSNPYGDIFAFILQNGRWDNAKKNLKPEFYGNNELQYNSLSDKNIFRGGNEYRYFDIKSIRYQTEYIKKIDFVAPNYNVYLLPSENREFKPYFYWQDFNGKYYVAVQEGRKADTDADYVYVYFTLPSKQMIAGGNIYVSGALSNWAFDSNNIMTYNSEKGEYECTMLLKQGWYNYEYVFLKNGENGGSASYFEGSHYETENDYVVLVYFRNPRGRYDRVVGHAILNTLNHMTN